MKNKLPVYSINFPFSCTPLAPEGTVCPAGTPRAEVSEQSNG